jgi:hypothetical protein
MEGYEVIFARYSSDGRLLTTRNITNTSSLMMGYIDVNQEGSTLRFSMQRTFADSVTIYEVAANATQESDVTRVFTDELEAQLLDLCPDTHPCTQASFFSADFAPDGTMAFAFRLWDRAGHAIGNQAVGLLGVDRRVRSLTFDPTRPGTNNTNSVETCPRFHPKDATKLLYLRKYALGNTSLHVFDLRTNTTWLVATPNGIYDDPPSCPELWKDGSLLYIDRQYSKHDAHLVHAELQDDLKSVATVPLIRDVQTTDGFVTGVLSFYECKPLSEARGDVACLNKYHELAIMHGTANESKWTKMKLPWTRMAWCRTNSCYKIFRRGDAADTNDVFAGEALGRALLAGKSRLI